MQLKTIIIFYSIFKKCENFIRILLMCVLFQYRYITMHFSCYSSLLIKLFWREMNGSSKPNNFYLPDSRYQSGLGSTWRNVNIIHFLQQSQSLSTFWSKLRRLDYADSEARIHCFLARACNRAEWRIDWMTDYV